MVIGVVSLSHQVLYSVFEVQMVLEADIVNKFADKYCHAAADAVSSNRKRPLPSNREQLDREPASIGEQVLLLELVNKLYVLSQHIHSGCSQGVPIEREWLVDPGQRPRIRPQESVLRSARRR